MSRDLGAGEAPIGERDRAWAVDIPTGQKVCAPDCPDELPGRPSSRPRKNAIAEAKSIGQGDAGAARWRRVVGGVA